MKKSSQFVMWSELNDLLTEMVEVYEEDDIDDVMNNVRSIIKDVVATYKEEHKEDFYY